MHDENYMRNMSERCTFMATMYNYNTGVDIFTKINNIFNFTSKADKDR